MRIDMPSCSFTDCKYNQDHNCFAKGGNREGCEFRILSEKETPKKPKKLTYEPLINHGWKWECPNCGLAVGGNKNATDYTDQDKFCPSCGQALKWSD
jgi:predicted RNA-binding Zn-ribbon protein involved in translation (DUF1610 family)